MNMEEMGAGLPGWLTTLSWAWIAAAVMSAAIIVADVRRHPQRQRVMAVAWPLVLAFDAGMLGWMVLLHDTENMPTAGDVRFTFLMQVGLVLGTLTADPAMRVLATRGSRVAS